MALLPEFSFRVTPGDLIPGVLLELPTEEQIERWSVFQVDIEDAFQGFAAFRSPFTVTMLAPAAGVVYTDAPAGGAAEWAGSARWRTWVDLDNLTEARVSVAVETAGAGTADAGVQYSADGGTSWFFLDGGVGPAVDISSTGAKLSAWGPIVSGAQNDVLLRFVHIGGDGVADPAVGLVVVQFR